MGALQGGTEAKTRGKKETMASAGDHSSVLSLRSAGWHLEVIGDQPCLEMVPDHGIVSAVFDGRNDKIH